jgi:hemolysin activation/secretion protein
MHSAFRYFAPAPDSAASAKTTQKITPHQWLTLQVRLFRRSGSQQLLLFRSQSAQLLPVVSAHTGRSATPAGLHEAARAARQFYRECGYQLDPAYRPGQDLPIGKPIVME